MNENKDEKKKECKVIPISEYENIMKKKRMQAYIKHIVENTKSF